LFFLMLAMSLWGCGDQGSRDHEKRGRGNGLWDNHFIFLSEKNPFSRLNAVSSGSNDALLERYGPGVWVVSVSQVFSKGGKYVAVEARVQDPAAGAG
jgi:hypothetical protein